VKGSTTSCREGEPMVYKPIQIDWITRNHIKEVVSIEKRMFYVPWKIDDFIKELRRRSVIGKVAVENGKVKGYAIARLKRTSFNILNVAVHPGRQREGIGTMLMCSFIEKLRPEGRTSVRVMVDERNLHTQLFLRGLGFFATKIIEYDNGVAYDMRYFLMPNAPCMYQPVNRIKHFIGEL